VSLNDLEKKLYDPDSGIEKREHESSQFDPIISEKNEFSGLKEEKNWGPKVDDGIDRKKIFKIGALALGGILLLAVLFVGFVKFRQSAFSEERVLIRIEGPSETGSAQKNKYRIVYENNNRTELKNAQILLNYSENFKPEENANVKIDNPSNSRINLGTVKGNSKGEIDLYGTFFSVKDNVIYLNAVIKYIPGNFNSEFNAKGQLGVNVNSSPLFLEVQSPNEVASGNKIDYVIDYRNSSSEYFDSLKIKVEYPTGFSFITSDPSSSEGNGVWYLGSLKPEQSGRIVISGSIQGEGNESKAIRVYLGQGGDEGNFIVYNQKDRVTKIASSILSISQSVNSNNQTVNTGEELRYVIEYKNNGDMGIKDAIVTLEIDSKILDFSKIQLKKGFYDIPRKTITWRASEIPELANINPGSSGRIDFSLLILDRLPIEGPNDKNFTIVTTAKIDSPSIPNPIGSNKIIASNRMELKLNSRVVLETTGFYKDNHIENSGPIPPQVGKETTFTMHWKIINVSNDVNNIKVISYLPSGIRWTGKTYPENESLSFNERTNQIEWNALKTMQSSIES
jgi:uncharacterized repeat protein (TIGR01451 family)